MPKRKRTEAAKRGWKKRASDENEGNLVKHQKLGKDELMVKAIEMAKYGKMGVNRATKEFGKPRATLRQASSMGENQAQHPTFHQTKRRNLCIK